MDGHVQYNWGEDPFDSRNTSCYSLKLMLHVPPPNPKQHRTSLRLIDAKDCELVKDFQLR